MKAAPISRGLPSIRQRLNRVVWLWSLLWGAVVMAAAIVIPIALYFNGY